MTRNHSYIFDMSDASNFGYYLSFSQDNQYKLEYSFNVIEREGTPGLSSATETPVVKFTIGGEVTNITYYFDPSRLGANSPVGNNSFIDVIKTPFDGKFTISEVISDTEFRFKLLHEPEFTNAEIGEDEFDRPNSSYSTTSVKAIGPINTIKLISPGGFYKKLLLYLTLHLIVRLKKSESITVVLNMHLASILRFLSWVMVKVVLYKSPLRLMMRSDLAPLLMLL